jgi:uncharacterized protein (UPF0332 family)
LDTAKHLAASLKGKPRQAHLRRAVSTAYYALFHHLAKSCADTVVGSVKAKRCQPAWRQTYRSLAHGPARAACNNKALLIKFPPAIQDFANLFVQMQVKRHEADYDPTAKLAKSSVLTDIGQVEAAIDAFERVAAKHKRAFVAFVLFKQPSN